MSGEKHTQEEPSREQPELVSIGLSGIPITDVEHWVEDGSHHLNSLDFGLTVSGGSFNEVLNKMRDSVKDYRQMLEDLPREELTSYEKNIFSSNLDRK